MKAKNTRQDELNVQFLEIDLLEQEIRTLIPDYFLTELEKKEINKRCQAHLENLDR